MNICPITYQHCEGRYSLQGVQPKLSAKLNVSGMRFDIVDVDGRYILKPQNPRFDMLPENEDLTMRLAALAGVDVPLHGLIYSKDGSLTYFIKRFDRIGRNQKLALEDFAQLLGLTRDTKYDGSMEKVASVIENHCTFPMIERIKLFRIILINFLIGNEDMHLKNFSLITRREIIELSPAYDFLNTTIALASPQEEIALPLRGKKRKLNRTLLVEYFGRQRLALNRNLISKVLGEIEAAVPKWQELIEHSFLSDELKSNYIMLLDSRCTLIF